MLMKSNKANLNTQNSECDTKYHYPTYSEIVQAHIQRTGTIPSFEEKMRYQGIKVIVEKSTLTGIKSNKPVVMKETFKRGALFG